MVRIPSNHRLAERRLATLVDAGYWRIDDSDAIWIGPRPPWARGQWRTGMRAEKQQPEGYLMVRATIGGKRVVGLAHRLVWHCFNGPIEPGLTVNHKNGNKGDNRPGNLELRTYSEQLKHAHANRLLDQRGDRNPNAKLTDDQVEEMRRRRVRGESLNSLADTYGVAFQTVSVICRGLSRSSARGPTIKRDGRLLCSRDRGPDGRFVKMPALDGRVWDQAPEPAKGGRDAR